MLNENNRNRPWYPCRVRFEEVYQRQKNAVYGYLSYMTKDKDTAEDSMICEVNLKEHYLVTEHGTVYRAPEEFSRYMVQYQEDCLDS